METFADWILSLPLHLFSHSCISLRSFTVLIWVDFSQSWQAVKILINNWVCAYSLQIAFYIYCIYSVLRGSSLPQFFLHEFYISLDLSFFLQLQMWILPKMGWKLKEERVVTGKRYKLWEKSRHMM